MRKPTVNSFTILFDLDGTLTQNDTFLEYLRFNVNILKYFFLLALLIPRIILFKINLISATQLKQDFLKIYLKDKNVKDLRKKSKEFLSSINWRNKILTKLKIHQSNNDYIILVTASINLYVEDIADYLGIKHVICTNIEIKNGRITGNLKGLNCNKEEKKYRLINKYKMHTRDKSKVIAYGNSKDDFPMFELAKTVFWCGKSKNQPPGTYLID